MYPSHTTVLAFSQIHDSVDDLRKHVDKKCLPREYGGDHAHGADDR